jgi:hypothetical protein
MFNALLEALINSSDLDMALMSYDTLNGTALLSQWEELQHLYDNEGN